MIYELDVNLGDNDLLAPSLYCRWFNLNHPKLVVVIDPYTTHTYYPDESQWTHWHHWNDGSIAVNHPQMAFENSYLQAGEFL
jgi:hypothetical protein